MPDVIKFLIKVYILKFGVVVFLSCVKFHEGLSCKIDKKVGGRWVIGYSNTIFIE